MRKSLFILPTDIPLNIRTPQYKEFIKDYYNNKKKDKPPKTSPSIGTGNRCIDTNENILSTSQSIVNITMKVLCKPENTNRGLLVWHSTGSGKLCTAVGAIEAFWDSPYKIIFCTSVEALNSNPPFKLEKENGKLENSFYPLLDYYSTRVNKGIAFLGNDYCFSTLTPLRLKKLNDAGLYLQGYTICNVKKWRGRYFFMIFTKENNPKINYLIKNYE
jgi:hypothetical protein